MRASLLGHEGLIAELRKIVRSWIPNSALPTMADSTLAGRAVGAGTGEPQHLTPTQGRTLLNVADGANNYSHPNHSGDVTSVGDGAQTIANDAVSNAKLADMAARTIKCRAGTGTGDPGDLALSAQEFVGRQAGDIVGIGVTADQWVGRAGVASLNGNSMASLRTAIATTNWIDNAQLAQMATATVKGRNTAGTGDPEDLTTIPTGTVPAFTGGDVTSAGGSLALTIANDAVTNAKLANMAARTLKGRAGTGTGDPGDISIGTQEFVGRQTGDIAGFGVTAGQWVGRTSAGSSLNGQAITVLVNELAIAWTGSSFAGSPEDGQLAYRTDHDTLYVWDATKAKWLSVAVYEIAFGDTASVASGTYFRQYPISSAAQYSSTVGERFGFDVVVVGIAVDVTASSTCTITVEDDGSDVTGGAISLSSETTKRDETLNSSTIASGSVIGVKCTSGTATTGTSGRVRFRRVAT